PNGVPLRPAAEPGEDRNDGLDVALTGTVTELRTAIGSGEDRNQVIDATNNESLRPAIASGEDRNIQWANVVGSQAVGRAQPSSQAKTTPLRGCSAAQALAPGHRVRRRP
ncbi:hypothetical protein, partial [Asanoa hainanensis]|uniref:hypothetical protein n=1 Tax=Asanoa hainanensis TaxID=560556 RepID=UPI0015C67743